MVAGAGGAVGVVVAGAGDVVGLDDGERGGVVVGLVVVGGVIISLIRRWMRGGDEAVQIGFSLSDLRAMHAEGRISSEELARAEQRLIQQVRGNLTEEDLQRRAEIQNARTTGPSSPTGRPSDGDLPE